MMLISVPPTALEVEHLYSPLSRVSCTSFTVRLAHAEVRRTVYFEVLWTSMPWLLNHVISLAGR